MKRSKQELIDLLVQDFKETEGAELAPHDRHWAAINLGARLQGFEVSQLELLASQVKAKEVES